MRALVLACGLLLAACGGGSGGPGRLPTRSFRMGFTPFPHDGQQQGLLDAFAVISSDGDLAAMHFDDGVPWASARLDQAHPDRAGLQSQAALIPAGHAVYLAVTPINIGRDGLAPDYPSAPLTPPWDGYAFDHPDVVTAFFNHCEEMISIFSPDYLAYAIEADLLHANRPDLWAGFVALAGDVYAALKALHPDRPVFLTISAEGYWNHRLEPADPVSGLTHTEAIEQLLAVSDYVAVSSYPILWSGNGDPALLPADYYTALAALAPGKPFAVGESGWPAEDLDAPWPFPLAIDAVDQRSFYEFLLMESEGLEAAFVVAFFTRDWDALWNSGTVPQTDINRFFRDMGMLDGAGTARQALTTWRAWLNRLHRT